jgi:thymidylate synthase
MNGIYLQCASISDAWFQLIYNLFDYGYRQDIQQGSFEDIDYRLQYPSASINISHPWLDMVPYIPPSLGIPSPTTEEYISDYFVNYLMDPTLGENETYKYASRIHYPLKNGSTQLEGVIKMLKKTPMTNQAVIAIGSPTDLDDCWGNDGEWSPPCLRTIDFKVIPPNQLTISVYFRSWDLYAALPVNLGGLELLKQYVAEETGLQNGCMYAYSAGLHIYGYQNEIAKLRILK